MNPQDRGVDEVDAAFERRFARIALDPDDGILAELLAAAGMAEPLRERVVEFFEFVQDTALRHPQAALGHTYFIGAKDVGDLVRVWNHQLRFFFEKAFRLDRDKLAEIYEAWDRVVLGPHAG